MKMPIALAFAAVLAGNAFAQQSGVSNPPENVQDIPQVAQPAPVAAATSAEATPQAKPSAAETYGEYKPYGGQPVLRARAPQPDPDAGIVTEVPRHPNELPEGTSLHITLDTAIDTAATQPNTPFRGELTEELTNASVGITRQRQRLRVGTAIGEARLPIEWIDCPRPELIGDDVARDCVEPAAKR